jgi:hypothetical protein
MDNLCPEKIWATSVFFKKTSQSEQSANGRKFAQYSHLDYSPPCHYGFLFEIIYRKLLKSIASVSQFVTQVKKFTLGKNFGMAKAMEIKFRNLSG